MKKPLILLALFLIGLTALAQEETLFDNASVVGGFGGPLFVYSNVNNEFGSGAGGGGGVIINQFFIGGFGVGLGNFADVNIGNDRYEIDLGYGGFWLGYVPLSYKVIHPYVSTQLGWGGVSLDPDKEVTNDPDYNDAVFVVTPEAGLELNVFTWFRLSFTGGYRFVMGVDDIPNLTDRNLSSFSGALTLRFGGFGHYQRPKEPSNW